jgi:hypothetical protein
MSLLSKILPSFLLFISVNVVASEAKVKTLEAVSSDCRDFSGFKVYKIEHLQTGIRLVAPRGKSEAIFKTDFCVVYGESDQYECEFSEMITGRYRGGNGRPGQLKARLVPDSGVLSFDGTLEITNYDGKACKYRLL